MLVERTADNTDINFIYGCLLYGAKKGHYAVDAGNRQMLEDMKTELGTVVKQQHLLDGRRARASIYTEHDKRIAFLILSELFPDSQEFEIYALSVAQRYQHKGYASQIIRTLLNRLAHARIHARCSPASFRMSSLLKKHGFKSTATEEDFEILIKSTLETGDLAQPAYLKQGFS